MANLLDMLPPDVKSWLRGKLELSTGPGGSWAKWDRARGVYHIQISQDLDPAHVLGVLWHEIAHVLRGDLLATEVTDWHRWNIATDAVINSGLRSAGLSLPANIYYHEQFTGAPPFSAGARALYDWLGGQNQSDQGQSDRDGGQEGQSRGQGQGQGQKVQDRDQDSGLGPTGTFERVAPEDREAAEQMRRRLIATAPEAVAGMGLPGIRTAPRPLSYTVPPLSAFLERLLRTAKGGGSIRPPRRTYAREGRTPWTRGVHRPWSGRVVMALDASGSMAEYTPTYDALTQTMERAGLVVERWVWADRAAPWPQSAPMPDVGGGTQLVPLLEALSGHRFDAVVIFTDGEVADHEEATELAEALPTPIFWVLTGNGKAPFPGVGEYRVGAALQGVGRAAE